MCAYLRPCVCVCVCSCHGFTSTALSFDRFTVSQSCPCARALLCLDSLAANCVKCLLAAAINSVVTSPPPIYSSDLRFAVASFNFVWLLFIARYVTSGVHFGHLLDNNNHNNKNTTSICNYLYFVCEQYMCYICTCIYVCMYILDISNLIL